MAGLRATLRRLRHGPLARWGPFWVILGSTYRVLQALLPYQVPAVMKIGPYGPFRLDGRFRFSNFENWGSGRNIGFVACIEACEGARCFLDVGAHVGLIALPASRAMAADGRVVAFEPARANRILLERHVRLNGAHNITVVGDLVGEANDPAVPFFEQPFDSGLNSVVPGREGKRFVRSVMKQTTLDEYCAAHSLAPDVIKIDVEGAEIGVLRGARKIIEACQPLIVLSVHPLQIEQLGDTLDTLVDLVAALGYAALTPDGAPREPREPSEYILKPRS